jgi:hypothetical protein
MSLKINPIVATAILVGIGLLLVALIRGCNNNQHQGTLLVNYESRIKNLIEDSTETAIIPRRKLREGK